MAIMANKGSTVDYKLDFRPTGPFRSVYKNNIRLVDCCSNHHEEKNHCGMPQLKAGAVVS
eukprot:4589576-Ditylum_brightwellii.AAC.1